MHDVTHNPHGIARAASGHARLGYAGGSRRSPEPTEVHDPKMVRLFNCQLLARNLGNCRNVPARKNANHERHIPAWLFNMFGERVVIIIDGMLVNCSVCMLMSNDVTVIPAMRMAENKAKVVVARVAGRRFRSGDEDTLDGKGSRGRHHDDGSHTPKEWTPSKAQRTGSEVSSNEEYSGGLRYDKCLDCGVADFRCCALARLGSVLHRSNPAGELAQSGVCLRAQHGGVWA